MKYQAKLRLGQMGLSGRELNAIESMPELINDYQKLIDHNDRSEQIVALIRENATLTQEVKILRETIKLLCDKTGVTSEEFETYNEMVEDCIGKISKE